MAALALIIGVAVAAGWWAGRVAISDSSPTPAEAEEQVVATVVETTVGRTLAVTTTVTQPVAPIATNHLAGVVTAINPGPAYNLGDVLYAVNNLPVRVVVGAQPFYRDLGLDAEGVDVEALNATLEALDYRSATRADRFTVETELGVRAWQRALGIEPTGVVRLGELIAVPALPATLRLGEDIVTGGVLAGG